MPEGSRRQRRGLTNRYGIGELIAGVRQIRREEVETSLQHKTKSSIRYIAESRRSDNRASKVIGSTPGDPLRLSMTVAATRRKIKGTGLPRASALIGNHVPRSTNLPELFQMGHKQAYERKEDGRE